MRILAGCLEPDEGSVSGSDKASIVFQNPDDQFVYSTLIDDVAFGPFNMGLSREDSLRKALSALETTELADKKDRLVDTLSGGEKQRASLAGALALERDVLILDEVLSMMDGRSKESYLELLKSLREVGKTIILVTHDASDAVFADYVHIINDGIILKSGTPNDVLTDRIRLHSSGLQCPQITALAYALIDKGLSFSFIPLTREEFEEALCR